MFALPFPFKTIGLWSTKVQEEMEPVDNIPGEGCARRPTPRSPRPPPSYKAGSDPVIDPWKGCCDDSQLDRMGVLEVHIDRHHRKLQSFIDERLNEQYMMLDSQWRLYADTIRHLITSERRPPAPPLNTIAGESMSTPPWSPPGLKTSISEDQEVLELAVEGLREDLIDLREELTTPRPQVVVAAPDAKLENIVSGWSNHLHQDYDKKSTISSYASKSTIVSHPSKSSLASNVKSKKRPLEDGVRFDTEVAEAPQVNKHSTLASTSTARQIGSILSNAKREREKNLRTSHLMKSNTFIAQFSEDEQGRIFIKRPCFIVTIYVAILLNALQMGLQVDIKGGAWDVLWQVLDHIFTAIFAIEMMIKIYFLKKFYFFDRWNILDFFIALTSMLDSWLIPLVTGDTGRSEALKVLQLFRLLRMMKVLRLRRDLLALVAGLLASLKSMFWVSLLLFLAIYTAAILCVSVIGSEQHSDEYRDQGYDNVKHFGSLWKAMLTLFSISILDTWSTAILPIALVQPYMLPFFMAFLLLTSFALMNSIIGIIVEQTSEAAAAEAKMDDKRKREAKLERVSDLIDVVKQIDDSGDGVITVDEMASAEDKPDFVRILGSIDLPPGLGVADLHMMLDSKGTGVVTQEQFLEGMFQLIFCNEFQSRCLSQLSVSQVKRCVVETHHDMSQQISFLQKQFTHTSRNVDFIYQQLSRHQASTLR